jgi:hypothetical protein
MQPWLAGMWVWDDPTASSEQTARDCAMGVRIASPDLASQPHRPAGGTASIWNLELHRHFYQLYIPLLKSTFHSSSRHFYQLYIPLLKSTFHSSSRHFTPQVDISLLKSTFLSALHSAPQVDILLLKSIFHSSKFPSSTQQRSCLRTQCAYQKSSYISFMKPS